MLAEERRQQILDVVRTRGAARVSLLVEHLGVSEMTIRRDIADLAARGVVDRVHGGAVLPRAASVHEPGFAAKSVLEVAAKRAIARAAVPLVAPGTSVGVSAGTTTHAAAELLAGIPRLTVVTNSLPVAEVLHARGTGDQRVLLTGGERTPSDALVGPMAMAALTDLHLDVVLLGTHGLDATAGLTSPTLEEGQVNRALVAAGRRVVALADHTKWGVVGLATVARLEDVDVLVTDAGIDAAAREELRARVGRLVVAGEERETAEETT